MAPLSPRRSSRARPTQNMQSHQSSGSSGALGRPERNTRSGNKSNSSGKTTPSASLSSEPPEDLDDTLLGRRRKRNMEEEQDKVSRSDNFEMTVANDDLHDEEDEAVRCICGSDDYPGPPPAGAPDAEFFLQHELTEDVTGFFVQCDVCKVWQHGACVGIFSAESSPDEYFCESCRKEFHNIHTAETGQNYSRYLPTQRFSRAQSRQVTASTDEPKPPRTGGRHSRQNSTNQSSKRRSTMNSRDAAYDDEILRRVIEASKDAADPDASDAPDAPEGPRRTKRGRSDSEDRSVAVKRQRTDSRSVSPAVGPPETASLEDSDDSGSLSAKRTRSTRAQQEKADREDKERLRQDAVNKRKNRAERRRVDDSEVSEELPAASSSSSSNAIVSKSVEPPTIVEPPPSPSLAVTANPGTPPPPPPQAPPNTTAPSNSNKRPKSQLKKGKGRNQYTKDKEGEPEESPARSMSRDIQKIEEASIAPPKPIMTEPAKGKSKPVVSAKMSMLDMKRHVGAIMEFISRTQVDLAAEASPDSSGNQTPRKIDATGVNGIADGKAEGDGMATKPAAMENKDFKDLSCVEMMDVLTRDMVKWQNSYAA